MKDLNSNMSNLKTKVEDDNIKVIYESLLKTLYRLDKIILETPTGETRDVLCDCNIHLRTYGLEILLKKHRR